MVTSTRRPRRSDALGRPFKMLVLPTAVAVASWAGCASGEEARKTEVSSDGGTRMTTPALQLKVDAAVLHAEEQIGFLLWQTEPDGTQTDVTEAASYASSDPAVLAISPGVIVGHERGEVTITARFDGMVTTERLRVRGFETVYCGESTYPETVVAGPDGSSVLVQRLDLEGLHYNLLFYNPETGIISPLAFDRPHVEGVMLGVDRMLAVWSGPDELEAGVVTPEGVGEVTGLGTGDLAYSFRTNSAQTHAALHVRLVSDSSFVAGWSEAAGWSEPQQTSAWVTALSVDAHGNWFAGIITQPEQQGTDQLEWWRGTTAGTAPSSQVLKVASSGNLPHRLALNDDGDGVVAHTDEVSDDVLFLHAIEAGVPAGETIVEDVRQYAVATRPDGHTVIAIGNYEAGVAESILELAEHVPGQGIVRREVILTEPPLPYRLIAGATREGDVWIFDDYSLGPKNGIAPRGWRLDPSGELAGPFAPLLGASSRIAVHPSGTVAIATETCLSVYH